MSFSFSFGGHARTKEAEAEIVRKVHDLWAAIKEHAESGFGNVHTTHFGVGHPDAIGDPDDPEKNVTTDEEGKGHLDHPVAPSSGVSSSSLPSGGSTDPTALAPDSYSTPSAAAPQGDTGRPALESDPNSSSSSSSDPNSSPDPSDAEAVPPSSSQE